MQMLVTVIGPCKSGKTRALKAMMRALRCLEGWDGCEIKVTTMEYGESKDGTLLDGEAVHKFGVTPGSGVKTSAYCLFEGSD